MSQSSFDKTLYPLCGMAIYLKVNLHASFYPVLTIFYIHMTAVQTKLTCAKSCLLYAEWVYGDSLALFFPDPLKSEGQEMQSVATYGDPL